MIHYLAERRPYALFLCAFCAQKTRTVSDAHLQAIPGFLRGWWRWLPYGNTTTPFLRFYPTFDDPLKASLGDVLLRLLFLFLR